jgi:hypothetical protein
MRTRLVFALTSAGTASAALGTGCFDLFHSTDFDNACVFDADADGCPTVVDDAQRGGDSLNRGDGADQGETGDDGGAGNVDVVVPPTDFCAWDSGTSHEAARRACAWLGACWGPFGSNEFGTCLDYALRAYDCAINPSFPVVPTGSAHGYWDCLQNAASCDDVTRCVFPGGQQSCLFNKIACGGGAASRNASTLMDCTGTGPPLAAAACIAVGQTCDPNGTVQCSAASDGGCTPLGCEGTTLRDCNSGGTQERGIDCSSYGAGSCTTIHLVTDAGADAAMSTCAPKDASASCSPSPNVYCNLGVVSACFAGTLQQLDCRALLEDAGTCDTNAGAGQPIWDLSRYCVPNGGGCTESCSDGVFIACHRNKPVQIACASYKLKGECQMLTYGGAPSHPACVKP